MYRKHLLPALFICILLALPAAAQAGEPTQTLRQLHSKINRLLKKNPPPGSAAEQRNKEQIKGLVNSLLDFEQLAKLSLGKHWKERSDTEREEFVALLRDLIERNYIKQLRSNLGYKLEYRDEKIKADAALVKTAIIVKKDNRPTEILIDYKMNKIDGKWVVFDVITDEVSLVRNYRSQFNRIIRKDSYKELVRKMKNKLDEIS